jgi:hypothetical protein
MAQPDARCPLQMFMLEEEPEIFGEVMESCHGIVHHFAVETPGIMFIRFTA